MEDIGGDGVSAAASDDELQLPVPRKVMDPDEFLASSDRKDAAVDADLGPGDGSLEGLSRGRENQGAGRPEEIAVQPDDKSLAVHLAVGTHLCGGFQAKKKEQYAQNSFHPCKDNDIFAKFARLNQEPTSHALSARQNRPGSHHFR